MCIFKSIPIPRLKLFNRDTFVILPQSYLSIGLELLFMNEFNHLMGLHFGRLIHYLQNHSLVHQSMAKITQQS